MLAPYAIFRNFWIVFTILPYAIFAQRSEEESKHGNDIVRIAHFEVLAGSVNDDRQFTIFDSSRLSDVKSPPFALDTLTINLKIDETRKNLQNYLSLIALQIRLSETLDTASHSYENWALVTFKYDHEQQLTGTFKPKADFHFLPINGKYVFELLFDEQYVSTSFAEKPSILVNLKFRNPMNFVTYADHNGQEHRTMSFLLHQHPLPLISHVFQAPIEKSLSFFVLISLLLCTVVPFVGLVMASKFVVKVKVEFSTMSLLLLSFYGLLLANVAVIALYFFYMTLFDTLKIAVPLNVLAFPIAIAALSELRESRKQAKVGLAKKLD